jgi:hypothetical protein
MSLLDQKAVVTAFIHKLGRGCDQAGFAALLADDVVGETLSEPVPVVPNGSTVARRWPIDTSRAVPPCRSWTSSTFGSSRPTSPASSS